MKWSADYILKPLIILLNGSGTLILRMLGVSHSGGHAHVHSPEEIIILVKESYRGGVLDAKERQMLGNLFRASTKRAEEVAVPRNRIVAVDADEPLLTVLKLAADSAYTRIPVFRDNIDNIIGFVHLRDLYNLYRKEPDAVLGDILRPIPFVPETLPAGDVWRTFNETQSYLAVVFDEYGGTEGLITREDLIEEVFGEVQDEFDHERALIEARGDGRYVVRGDMLVDDLNDVLDLKLSHEVANTIGGLVLEELGRMPEIGDSVTVDNIRLRVEAMENLAISAVSLTVLSEPDRTASQEAA
jgi:CBS domain containing-hemolysin-like protein